MEYFGELLLPGKLGHFFVVLSLVASAVASFAYIRSTIAIAEPDKQAWKRLARVSFIAEVVSVFAIFSIMFYLIYNHRFEYKYVWQHSSLSLEFKYLLACFWEGQEGSFLLWSIWHSVLGLILIRTAKNWEAPVMSIISFAQFCLATFIAGIYIFDVKIGSNPFVLLRDSGLLDNAPALHAGFDITQPLRQDYLSFIKDGNDLNPLLQNRWMVIHPPVLFLGFASTIVPFAYAVAGLWRRDHNSWTKAALPWSLFSAGILGAGIMMGAWWAYESLTFGGYWAWDPVENASLVPWLILVGGVHTLLIYRHTGHSLRATYLFLILSFLFVLYSSYLTRSGDLQDTSVHAFTGDGAHVKIHLRAFLLIFVLPALFLFFRRYSKIPHVVKEEQTSSREFWMFIGSLVFFFASLFIISITSVPVFNSIASFFAGEKVQVFKPKAMGDNPEFTYNRIMIFVAIVIGLLTAVTQYLKYKGTHGKIFRRKIMWPTAIALVVGALVLAFGNIDFDKYGIGYLAAIWLAVASSIYAIIANAAYIWLGVRGSLKLSGGSVAHLGFGLMLLGILISASKREVISWNQGGIMVPLGEQENPGENLTLVKGQQMEMGKYWVTYEKDSTHPKKSLWYYNIRFKSKDGKEEFTLSPNAFVNYKGNEGLMANPDSRHYLDHDIFTYITSLPNPDRIKEDTSQFRPVSVAIKDTLYYSKGYIVVDTVETKENIPFPNFKAGDKAYVATLKVQSTIGTRYTLTPILLNVGGHSYAHTDSLTQENLIVQLNSVSGNNIELGVKENDNILEYVTLKAYVFPFINFLWGGTVLMVIGFFMSMVRRISLNRKVSAVESKEIHRVERAHTTKS